MESSYQEKVSVRTRFRSFLLRQSQFFTPKAFSNVTLLFALFSILLYAGCQDDDGGDVKPEEVVEYSLLKPPVVNKVYNGSQFLIPEIAFNYPIDSPFRIETDTTVVDYLFELDSVYLTSNGVVGRINASAMSWNPTKDTLSTLFYFPFEGLVGYNINIELKLSTMVDGEWVAMKFENEEGNYKAVLYCNISTIDDVHWVKGIQMEEGEQLNPYRPVVFDLKFIPKDEFMWVDSLNRDIKYVYDINLQRDGQSIEFEYEIHSDTRELEILPKEILCESCEYSLMVEGKYLTIVFGEEQELADADGVIEERSVFTFASSGHSTAEGIALGNIDYSYPVDRQYHFLVKEYPKGYMKVYHEQEGLFKSTTNSTWTKHVRFSDLAGVYSQEVALSYSNLFFEYDMPEDFAKETIYKGEFLEKSDTGEESIFYTFYFRTSLYDTFMEKIQENGPSNFYWRDPIHERLPPRYICGNFLPNNKEAFGEIEINGVPDKHIEPMLVLYNDFANNEFYQTEIYSRIYEAVDKGLLTIESYLGYGVPPINSVFWRQNPSNIQMSDDQIEANDAPNAFKGFNPIGIGSGKVEIRAHTTFVDHHIEIVKKAKAYKGEPNDLIQEIINNESVFLILENGEVNFPYYIEYRLPGNQHTSKYYHTYVSN
ncbi:hypothetical protein N6H18_11235 [Reichenbachiella agarivorans]|uniref:Uncharacterized protein n=1 Tax=Reichenbachiella agarivorans TaxID=2979464 RepID=A0ABY6CK75_9BACT|nr:hypothetical protein [Reichenbachiella agarivorans]UXP30924.1 hypothetical protein N6H18_11235 [Reichenbachiella agarivorans]